MARLRLDPTPARWAPPRGPRELRSGAWRPWLARPVASYADDAEVEVVQAWRELVGVLTDERWARRWGLRRLASAAGVSLSVVTDLEQGNAWPRVRTVEAVADALGFALEVEHEPGHRVVEGLMRQLGRQRRTEDGLSARQLAEYAGVRANTLYELPQAVAGGSVRTLLVLARQLDVRVILVPATPSQRGR